MTAPRLAGRHGKLARRSGILIGGLLMFSTVARADGPFNFQFYTGAPPQHRHAPTEDPDLDRAMAWCDNHMHETYNGSMGGNRMYGYDDDRCGSIEGHWANSRTQTAAREAEAAAKKAADQAWFDQYVKSIGEARR
jgi:hypothetical protein